MELYDAFISHASEDKDAFVRPLAHRLEEAHIKVWFDEFELKVGDSLSEAIDRGLATSRFGIVVLSPSFFAKKWPKRELAGLVARQMAGDARVILPIWLDMTKEGICRYSPTLADTVAVQSGRGLDEVVRELKKTIRPQGSPLIVARDRLIDFGLAPPVVTDEWWLDIVEASNRQTSWGFVSDRPIWGRWTFPLPEEDATAEQRGERLAWTAMQLRWEVEAEELCISQVTPPDEVLAFIESQSGLHETTEDFPVFLATYAPQLTIRGFGGTFERAFDKLLMRSRTRAEGHRGTSSGTALTTDAEPPGCDEFVALRHSQFGGYHPASIACQFVQGDVGGPQCKFYPTFEYIVWLLSRKSDWMPAPIRDFLMKGMADWPVWLWYGPDSDGSERFGLAGYPEMGVLGEALVAATDQSHLQMTKAALSDLTQRIAFSRKLLHLPEPSSRLVKRFLDSGLIEGFFHRREVNAAQRKGRD